jgi:hypothetical protein
MTTLSVSEIARHTELQDAQIRENSALTVAVAGGSGCG